MLNVQFSRWRVLLLGFALLGGAVVSGQKVESIKAIDLEKTILESKTPLIVNFWATWCVPCIEEIPYFLEEVKEHQKDSLRIILVSLDFKEAFPKNISSFAKKRKFNAPIFWLDETNADYFCPKVDPKWSGAIPATLFINNSLGYRNFYEEQMSHEDLKKEIKAMLGKTD
jgi:thiol-disulfide isomerase/thioredoxin